MRTSIMVIKYRNKEEEKITEFRAAMNIQGIHFSRREQVTLSVRKNPGRLLFAKEKSKEVFERY